ncbi:MAG: hypothetical protein WBB36_16450, partial [Chitinophagales bacterium]
MWQLLMFRLIITFAGFIIVLSCSSKQVKQPVEIKDSVAASAVFPKEIFPVDSVIRSLTCANDPTQSLALYLPPSYSSEVKLPVIVFFDPHGDGSLPVSKYHSLAKQFNYILIGSNNAKNGLTLSQTNTIIATLLNDSKYRISIDEQRISLAGFSGGAKVALSYASDQNEISNVIYAGAAVALQHPNPGLVLLGFAGVNDMNYTDLLTFDQSLAAHNLTHYLIEWNGKHEWPDAATFQHAFYWITFNSMRSHLQEPDKEIIKEYKHQHEKAMQISTAPIAKAMLLNEALNFLHGISSTELYSQQLTTIGKNKTYQEEIIGKQQAVQKEQALKQEYYSAFSQKDLKWWNQEIARMNSISDPVSKPMYQRLLGFISLACYSISGNAIHQNQWETAKKILAVYRLADPENADQAFFEACYFAKTENPAQAITSLKRAVALGLKDPAK